GLAFLVVHRPAPWLALLRRVTHAVLPARFGERLIRVAEGLVAGLEVLKSPGRFLGVVGWSVVQWLVNAAAFAVCFRAFGLAAHAKLNLLLRILAREAHGRGYHQIETAFALLELADELVVRRAESGIALTVHGPDLGPPQANLAVRAAQAVLEATGGRFGVTIELTKRIPARAGLGGGSSDAAAALHAVNALAGNVVPRYELLQL